MRSLLSPLLLALLAAVLGGCSPSAKTKSEEDIARADEKLSEFDEMQKVEEVTGNDFNKMTRVDPNLKQEAMADYDRAVRDDPSNAEAYYVRGFAQLSHGDALLKAIDDFTKAIELKPDYARAYLMRGRAYRTLGDEEKAEADRAKALELDAEIEGNTWTNLDVSNTSANP